MKKRIWTYDIEVYPTFFSASFKLVSKKTVEWREFIIFYDTENTGKSINDHYALVDFLNNEVEKLVGYNSVSYDNPIINHLRQQKVIRSFKGLSSKDICQNLKDLSDAIINSQNGQSSDYISFLRRSANFKSLDLFLLFNTIQRKSLKQISINLKHDTIQDLPYDISHIVKYDEIKKIMEYNKNDVIITEKLLYALTKEITDREDIYNKEKLDVRNDNDVNIGKRILRKYYEQESGKKYDDYKDLRSWYKKISLNECVSNKIKFKTPKYQKVLHDIRSKIIDPTRRKKKVKGEKSDFEFIVSSKEMTHTIAKGGIHSNNKPGILQENSQYEYWDIDVTSFYPFIILNEGYFPRHLGPEWLKGFKLVVDDRVDAKSKGNKTKADMLKISVNGAYGLTKSEHSWMFDPKVTLSVCVNGELYLLMLIEAIELHTDCVVVYSNTDGLTVRVPIGKKPDFDHICDAWMKYTGFGLEYTKYKCMILKDVNNYIIEYYKEQEDKSYKIELKQKGEFVTGIKLSTGYEFPIIPIALEKYFINNIPIEDTITNHKDIYDFMRAEKSSAKFKMIHQTIDQIGTKEHTKLQKNNRWIVTKNNLDQGKLFKVEFAVGDEEDDDLLLDVQEELFNVDIDESLIISYNELEAGYLTTIVNTIDESIDIKEYKLNYKYYIDKANSIIRKIEHKEPTKKHQVQLF